jgi:hypothetical protein
MILIRAGKTNYLCSIDRTRCAAASSRSYQSLRDRRLPEPSLFTNLKRYVIKSDGSRLLFCFGHEHPPIQPVQPLKCDQSVRALRGT